MKQREVMELLEWSEQHRSCAICWWPSFDHRRGMEVHHLVGGPNRSKGHSPFNYLKLCDRCHHLYHSGKIVANVPALNMRHLLSAKKETDEEIYDPAKLAALKNRKALHWEEEPIPEYYMLERQRNVGHYNERMP